MGRIGRNGRIRYPLTAAERKARELRVLIIVCMLASVVGLAVLVARW